MSLESLLRFVDDELSLAPSMVDLLLQELVNTLPETSLVTTGAQRNLMVAMRRAVNEHRRDITEAFCGSLRDRVAERVRQIRGSTTSVSFSPSSNPLSVVDDEAAAADVEVARVIESIRDAAEYELRELGALTSALLGDMDVARETHPFHPDVYAHALQAAAGALPKGQDYQQRFIHDATPLLAQRLRKAYAAACTRIGSHGIEPARHGIPVTNDIGTRRPVSLQLLRDSMPMPLDAPTAGVKVDIELPVSASGAAGVDRAMIEMLSRLFDTMLSDETVPKEMKLLMAKLQAPALRVALFDPITLGTYSHPLWKFLDRLAFDLERLVHRPGERERVLRFADTLLHYMILQPVQNASVYEEGLERLMAFEEQILELTIRDASSQVAVLSTLPTVLLPSETTVAGAASQPLDPSTLDTVPADLMESVRDERTRSGSSTLRALPAAAIGQWTRLFLQGQWREVQLLWRDEAAHLRLYLEGGSGNTWALSGSALERLHGEGLMQPLEPHSLVEAAAHRLLAKIQSTCNT